MLYADSSALVKAYVREAGSSAMRARLESGEEVFTSALTYAEIHAALARKQRSGDLSREEFATARDAFAFEWAHSLQSLELDVKTASAVPDIVERFDIKASDAVHLAAALWVQDMVRRVPAFAAGEVRLEFAVSDKPLARIAAHYGLAVFDPENR
ncbi:MAG TPA: type II toxin-antitoxin system VapC family toxin [Candidatus Acidoferrales bacterium]